jgi:thiamine biosynthesis lipoprotein
MTSPTRRRFLCLAAGLGSAWKLGLAESLMRESSGAEKVVSSAGPLKLAKRTSWALGSDVSITAFHRDQRQAEAGIDDAFAELELVEQLMSIYRPDSQLSRLNRDGILANPHPYLVRVLRYSQELSRRTDGAFDVTVQPLWASYAQQAKRGELPDKDQLGQAAALVDWRQVEVSGRQIRFRRDGMSITLNGVAQGFAADRATDALRAREVRHALINTGEIGALGTRADGDAWTIGVQHPRQSEAFVSLAKLDGRCLATSGDYETYFSDDFRHNHLLDPRTGRSPAELASVSVVAPTAMEADALSTALFVLGPELGSKLIAKTPNADALLVLKNGRTLATDGFPTG